VWSTGRNPAEDHWLSRQETRVAMVKASVAFVMKNNPPDQSFSAAECRAQGCGPVPRVEHAAAAR